MPISDERNSYAGNQGCAHRAQKSEDHQDDQDDRDDQRQLDIVHRGSHRGRAVEDYAEIDGGRDRSLQLRQGRADAIDGGDDVRARLAKDDDQHGRLAVGQSDVTNIFDRILHIGNVSQP